MSDYISKNYLTIQFHIVANYADVTATITTDVSEALTSK